MNWKFTLILVALVAALYVFFDFYENKQPDKITIVENQTRVFAFDRNQIDGLTISRNDQKIDLARGTNNKWTVKTPLVDRADQSVIDEVMTNLEILRWQDNISGKEIGKGKLGEFGLQPPRERLTITGHGGHTTELLFGNDTALEGRNYLQLTGTPNVYVVPDSLKKLLDKNVDAWRDHHLTDIPATDVTRLVIKNAAGEIELQRDGEHWKLVRPLAARADDAHVKDTISQITNLEVTSFVADDKVDAATYGLAEPKGTVTLYTANDLKGIELLVGNGLPTPKPAPGTNAAIEDAATPEKEKFPLYVYARMPSRQSIYTVPSTVTSVFALKPVDLRDHSLARINEDLVDRIRLLPAGASPITLVRKEKVWTILEGPAAGQPVEPSLVEKVISALTSDNISDFVADSAVDLSKYGLDKPLLQIKLVSFASENTAEGTIGEKPVAAVSFGKDDESLVYAQVADEPSVATVPKALVDQFPTDPLQWRQLGIFQVDPAKVNTMEIAVQGHPTLNLTRAEKGEWTTVGKTEGALDTVAADKLAETVARLRAVRWEGEVKPEYGLDTPKVNIKFSSTDAKIGGHLVLNEIGETGALHAQVDDKKGVFTVSRPSYVALTANLVPPPAPLTPKAAEPTPTTTPPPMLTPAVPAVPEATIPPAPAATPVPVPTVAPVEPAEPTVSPAATLPPVPSTPIPEPTIAPTPIPTPELTPLPASPVVPEAAPTPTTTPVVTPTPEQTPPPVSTPADIPAPEATPA